MTSTYIKISLLLLSSLLISACDVGSSNINEGMRVELSATPARLSGADSAAGEKTINVTGFGTVIIDKAYLVLSSITIEQECNAGFTASLNSVFDFIIPAAQAHTEETTTTTIIPVVVDLLAQDGSAIQLGKLESLPATYCGLSINMAVANDNALNLPTGTGEPDMIGKSLFISGTYNNTPFTITQTGTLIERRLLFLTPMALSAQSLLADVIIEIQYDSWFNSLDPAALDDAQANSPDKDQFYVNLSASLHQKS